MNPDDMASLLTEYFTEMVECVFRHGGTLDKFMGDAVMAQWGAPIGTPTMRTAPCSAAIDMMRALEALNAKWRGAGRPELGIGIGLSYGEAFAGQHRLRAAARVHRDRRHRQHRQPPVRRGRGGRNPPHRGDSPRRCAGRRRSRSAPPLELKGKAHPVPVYRVVRQ